jgi:transposase InsO family protein
MTTTAQRQNIVRLIEHACKSGARLHISCKQIGLTCRTLQRWLRPHAKSVSADHRQRGLRHAVAPHNKLTPQESDALLAVLNSEEFKDLPPSQIVPRLADEGVYLASESTMQRLLRSKQQNTHRRSEREPSKRHKPFALKATLVNQVYTWDITYLPTPIKGQYFYLYVFVDIFSRFIVGAQVFESESADLAAAMIKDICARHGIAMNQVYLHSDNGAPMKGQTMQAMMQELGVIASRSPPESE